MFNVQCSFDLYHRSSGHVKKEMDQRKCSFCQKTIPSCQTCKCIWIESDDYQESVSEINNSCKLNQSFQKNDGKEPQGCSLQPVGTDADSASAKFFGFNAGYCFFCNNRKECEALMRTRSRNLQCLSYGRDGIGDHNVDENRVTPFTDATTEPFGNSNQRKCQFCQPGLPSYEGCSCTWNENDDNKESRSEINNLDKLSQGHQQKDREEIQPCSLKPLKEEAELASANCLEYNAGDGLFCDNRKELENIDRVRVEDILCSSDDRNVSGDQRVDRNDVIPPVRATSESFRDTFQNLGKRKYQCSYCPKVFPTYFKHQRHILAHTREVPFMCGSCGQRFSQKAHLKRHRMYSERRTFICDQCGIEFPLKCALEAHLREERENKHFVCDFCGKKFFSKRHLLEHQRSHSRERPYKCSICGKDYVYGKGLRRHRKKHQ